MSPGLDAARTVVLVAQRQLRGVVASPMLALPPPVSSIAFLAALAGGLGALGEIPGFDYPGGYTGFQSVYLLVVSAAFGGVLTGLALAEDYSTGVAQRLLLAPVARGAVVTGYVLAGVVRGLSTAAIVGGIAVATGVPTPATSDLLAVVALCALVASATGLWSLGVALRAGSPSAGPVMQLPVFLALFAGPVFAPPELGSAWLARVGDLNPIAHVVAAARSSVAGDATGVGSAVTWMLVALVALVAWAGTATRGAGTAGP